jgi:hypothetical protein
MKDETRGRKNEGRGTRDKGRAMKDEIDYRLSKRSERSSVVSRKKSGRPSFVVQMEV